MNERMDIANLPYVEALFVKYLAEPSSVPDEWRRYFAAARLNGERPRQTRNNDIHPRQPAYGALALEFPAWQLNEMIGAYRTLGHLKARIDPLNLQVHSTVSALQPEAYGFSEAHLNKLVVSTAMPTEKPLALREMINRLETIYCGPIGYEFMHLDDGEIRGWIQTRVEAIDNRGQIDRSEQFRILDRLTDAQTFEEFIRKKFLGAKSFSLEGAEAFIPLLDAIIEKAAQQKVQEIVLAMAHRGRLNVLANILGKPPRDIFRDFKAPAVAHFDGSGDVKYHLGHSHDYSTRTGAAVHLSLCFNPSHLEFVNAVAAGRVRAKQDRGGDSDRARAMALLIHGDAAFSGEGVVQEVLNLSRLEAYDIGGALHIILNNQIGFTTPPAEARSSTYATDIAKGLQMPIFHVNGDDPESVVYAARLALDYRAKFHRDVIIDLYGYRRLGHNEADEPTFTQPRLYQTIAKHKNVRDLYLAHLLSLQRVDATEAAARKVKFLQRLEDEFAKIQGDPASAGQETLQGIWKGYRGGAVNDGLDIVTGIDRQVLVDLLIAQARWPDDFHPHPKIAKAVALRREMAQGNRPLDWSAAESLAFATLAIEKVPVRLSGQDSARGTFGQRHAVLHDHDYGRKYIPLQRLAGGQAPVEIYNSPLSESGVLGFEYGYSLDSPAGLTIWEAQFGDFVNAAQVVVDQFITTAEEKWRRLSGIVLLLPHGFEGMGPEHSSARLERFLQLCAKDNIQVVNPTTPAQYFHCLRRQALSRWRKPLVVMTPKSLLRHPRSVSALEDCSAPQFQTVITPASPTSDKPVERIVLCSGKVFYDLEKRQRDLGDFEVPIIRIEQLYPFPEEELETALARYPTGTPLIWAQEEPENMGAWWYLSSTFQGRLHKRSIAVIARPASASPATGSATRHQQQQNELLNRVFGAP